MLASVTHTNKAFAGAEHRHLTATDHAVLAGGRQWIASAHYHTGKMDQHAPGGQRGPHCSFAEGASLEMHRNITIPGAASHCTGQWGGNLPTDHSGRVDLQQALPGTQEPPDIDHKALLHPSGETKACTAAPQGIQQTFARELGWQPGKAGWTGQGVRVCVDQHGRSDHLVL